MTVSYSGNFMRLLLRWKGSIWRSVWIELVVFLTLYYGIIVFYFYGIPTIDSNGELGYKKKFHEVCLVFNEYTKNIPLTFLLGFYVSNIVSRWWRQFECLSWPEDLLTRNLIDAGLLNDQEYVRLEKMEDPAPGVRWMAPLHWIQQIVTEEVEAGRIPTHFLAVFMNELKQYRTSFRKLFCHDWVCVPLVYTQVGQDLMRPFGMDDDDIELSYILDRNLVISFAIADCLQSDKPRKFSAVLIPKKEVLSR
ncbi:unnamed protein product [Strongylus vulgaris]|uniref:Bestrophin homolog n=1 Tax=Strongylus vulgaris TaxID=40348 RepID=A0A3P7LCW5_STRVU|nr:unnamed protein product [Strongylus vulgaris]